VEEQKIVLGPMFTVGVVLVGAAIFRRSWPLAVLGAAAIAADQKLPLARRLADALSSE
jgi:hypothetical protein